MDSLLDLLDYRRTVAGIYGRLRAAGSEPPEQWDAFRRARDDLFATHPQSALPPEQRVRFHGLRYYPHDTALRFVVPVMPIDENKTEIIETVLRDDGPVRFRPVGRVQFNVGGQDVVLTLFWIQGYGGGIFLPFRDATNASETYEGGRYLLDTIKGADLGQAGARLILDFNYAYNPSCAYHPRWDCPLAPPENRLPVPIRAGELRYP